MKLFFNPVLRRIGTVLFGLILIAFGLLFFFKFDPDAYDGSTTGTITEIREERTEDADGEPGIQYTVYIDYSALGREYRHAEYGAYNSKMRVGDTVELYYMSADPSVITTPGKDAVPYISIGITLLGVVVIAACVLRTIRHKAG